jgi:hypothetical protein
MQGLIIFIMEGFNIYLLATELLAYPTSLLNMLSVNLVWQASNTGNH